MGKEKNKPTSNFFHTILHPHLKISTFRSFSSFDYFLIWLSGSIMIGAHQMMGIAQGYWIYELTDSATILGIIAAITSLPMLVLASISGTIADRFRKRLIILSVQTISLLISLFALFIIANKLNWQYFIFLGLMQGCVWIFNGPARQAWLPKIVSKNNLGNAIALFSTGVSIASIAGPAVAGVVYSSFGPEFVWIGAAFIFTTAIILTLNIKAPDISNDLRDRPFLNEIKSGYSYIFKNNNIRVLFLIGAVFTLLAFPIQSLLPVLIIDVYGKTSAELGLLASMLGIGAVVGNIIVASISKHNRAIFFLILIFTAGLCMLGITNIQYFSVGLILLFIHGIATGSEYSIIQILVMDQIDEEYRGRTMSFLMLIWGILPLGVFPAGIGVDHWGPQLVLSILGIGLLVLGTITIITQKWIRKIE